MGKFSILQYFREQWKTLPVRSGDVETKAVMVVGSNVGIGLEASVHLAHMKPRSLFTTCRNEEKCERTREVLMERTEDDGTGTTSTPPLDLSSFDSVRAFAATFSAEACSNHGLNVLVANTGTFVQEYTRTDDDWEVMFQVNYLCMALLSFLMLPHLVKASSSESPSRLVVVSSFGMGKLKNAAQWESVPETINDTKFCNSADRYNVSKSLQVMFVLVSRALHLSLHVPSNLGSAARTCSGTSTVNEQGSRTLVHAAVGDDPLAMLDDTCRAANLLRRMIIYLHMRGKHFPGDFGQRR